MSEYLLERLGEASTWRGIVALLTAAGIVFDPEQIEGIVATGLAVVGLIGAFTGDKRGEKEEKEESV